MSKIIAVTNQKGGVGKTTTSVNLAAALALMDFKVLIIDLDPQASATASLGINRGKLQLTIFDVLCEQATILEAIVQPEHVKCDLLPSTIDLLGVEIKLLGNYNREYILDKQLNRIKDLYDYIIIDCPPSLGLITLNALHAANSIIIPVQCQFLAIDGLTQLLNTIKVVQKRQKANNRNLTIEGVLLTMLDKRTKAGWEIVNEVKEYFGKKVFETFITINVQAQIAPAYGMPVIVYAPKSTSAVLYKNLAKELVLNNAK